MQAVRERTAARLSFPARRLSIQEGSRRWKEQEATLPQRLSRSLSLQQVVDPSFLRSVLGHSRRLELMDPQGHLLQQD